MNEKKEFMEINVLKLLQALVRRWWLIALATLIGAALALGYTIGFVTPMYQASVMLYVNNSTISIGSVKASISSGEISTARSLVDTYKVILDTRLTLEAVAEKVSETGTKVTYSALRSCVSAAAVNETEVFQVTVTHSSPETAMVIANTIAEVLPEKISEVIVGCSVKTVDLAVMPTMRSSPSYSRNIVIGAIAGAVISCLLLILLEVFNDTIDEEEWILETFNKEIPLLATIPNTSSGKGGYYGYKKYGYGYGKYGYGKYGYGKYGYYKKPDVTDEAKSDEAKTTETEEK